MPERTHLQVRGTLSPGYQRLRDTASTPPIGKTTVNNIIEKWKETNTLADKPVPGNPGERLSELIEL